MRLDHELREEGKLSKKEVFSLNWIDNIIDILEVEFNGIVRSGKFILESAEFTRREKLRSLRFCLFYVSLVMLRYTGVRQQCLRDCIYGQNIIFNTDGSITFCWTADQVKNDKRLEVTFDPKVHFYSHARLIRVLNLYHNKVYKYLVQKYKNTTSNQFFLKLSAHGIPINFTYNSEKDFYAFFIRSSGSFIDTARLCNTQNLRLNPHHFRALAADWYVEVLGLSDREGSILLGDSEATIRAAYRRKDRYVFTPILDKLNADLANREKLQTDLNENVRSNFELQQVKNRNSELEEINKKLVEENRKLIEEKDILFSFVRQQVPSGPTDQL